MGKVKIEKERIQSLSFVAIELATKLPLVAQVEDFSSEASSFNTGYLAEFKSVLRSI